MFNSLFMVPKILWIYTSSHSYDYLKIFNNINFEILNYQRNENK